MQSNDRVKIKTRGRMTQDMKHPPLSLPLRSLLCPNYNQSLECVGFWLEAIFLMMLGGASTAATTWALFFCFPWTLRCDLASRRKMLYLKLSLQRPGKTRS